MSILLHGYIGKFCLIKLPSAAKYKQTKLKIYTEEELKEREDKGKKEGIKEGIKEVEERGKAELIIRLLNKKIGKLPPHYEEKIVNLGENVLTDMADKIFEINDLKDIDKYI